MQEEFSLKNNYLKPRLERLIRMYPYYVGC